MLDLMWLCLMADGYWVIVLIELIGCYLLILCFRLICFSCLDLFDVSLFWLIVCVSIALVVVTCCLLFVRLVSFCCLNLALVNLHEWVRYLLYVCSGCLCFLVFGFISGVHLLMLFGCWCGVGYMFVLFDCVLVICLCLVVWLVWFG